MQSNYEPSIQTFNPSLQGEGELFYYDRWYPGQIELFDKQKDLSTADWAETYERWVTISDKPGPWKNENNPALKGLMDLMDYARKLFVLLKGVQTGGTEAAQNFIFKKADTAAGAIGLYVMDSEKKLKRIMNTRIVPTFEKTPKLKQRMSLNPDDTTNYSIKLQNGFVLNGAWATSQAMTSSDPCILVVIDEIDKSKDAINIQEAKDRITTYEREGKVLILSTPSFEDGPIMKELRDCEVIYDYHVGCPACGARQVMKFENFTWLDKDKPQENEHDRKKLANEIERDDLAEYICNSCGVLWDEYMRIKALHLGEWLPRHPVVKRPISIGAIYPSWDSPFKKMSSIVARWLRAQGDIGKLRGWYNNEAAEPFIEKLSERKEDDIMALRDDRPRGLVPKDLAILLASFDTQKHGFYYEVRAFGSGQSCESWQVREGYLETFEDVEDILYHSEYKDIDGNLYPIHAAVMDSGGGTGTVPKHSRTAEVYEFCRKNKIVRPVKGRQTMTKTVSPTRIDHFPRTRKPIPGGITLYTINVTYFKDQLATKLEINPTDPGAWHLHSECHAEYGRHMTAEYKDEKGKWQCPRNRANHYWDIGVYALALAEILQIKFWKGKRATPKKPESAESNKPPKRPVRQSKGGWVSGWK